MWQGAKCVLCVFETLEFLLENSPRSWTAVNGEEGLDLSLGHNGDTRAATARHRRTEGEDLVTPPCVTRESCYIQWTTLQGVVLGCCVSSFTIYVHPLIHRVLCYGMVRYREMCSRVLCHRVLCYRVLCYRVLCYRSAELHFAVTRCCVTWLCVTRHRLTKTCVKWDCVTKGCATCCCYIALCHKLLCYRVLCYKVPSHKELHYMGLCYKGLRLTENFKFFVCFVFP